MSLEATVQCDCFEKGLMKECPVDLTDVYVDCEGYLSSKRVDEARRTMSYRRFVARYEKLEEQMNDWRRNGCSHEDGEACSEWVGNWAVCAQFQALVEEAGGKSAFPLLSNLLPDGNGGIYPAEKAKDTLVELDRFIECLSKITEWSLRDVKTGEKIWSFTDKSSFTWIYGPNYQVGTRGNKVFFDVEGKPVVETSHFVQIPINDPDNQRIQLMRILCLDTGEETHTHDSIDPMDWDKIEREFHVVSDKGGFLFEGGYSTAERIRNLLVASIETGNPIRWC